ncbi:MAG: amidohydrolase [Chloroflexi bacterium]|nr:amidohydrolase [Chloroflexota bacterium]
MPIVDFRLRPPIPGLLALDVPYGRAGRWLPTRLGVQFPRSAEERSLELLFAEMAEAGIATGVIPGRTVPPGIANEEITGFVREHPDRFVGVAGIDLANRKQSVAEVERAIGELAMRGISIEPGFQSPPLEVDDPSVYPVYERAEQLGVPVLLTMSLFLGPDIGWCQRNTAKLDRVAGDFRRLNLVLCHASWPYVETAIGLALKRPNVYLSPDLYVIDMPFAESFGRALNGFLQDQFLFATAYPLRPLKETVDAFSALGLSDSILEKALTHNARRLLKL